jgi:disulfide oxidoreductase YuzD
MKNYFKILKSKASRALKPLKEWYLERRIRLILMVLTFVCIGLYIHFFPDTTINLPNKTLDDFIRGKNVKYTESAFKRKIGQLDSISSNLSELQEFLDLQKKNLEQQDKNYKELIKQNKALEPLVNVKKEIVEEIFNAQEKRNQKERKYDLLWGFILGVISSIIASLIEKYISRKFFRKNTAEPFS